MSETTDVTAITDDEIDLNKEFDFLSPTWSTIRFRRGVEVYEINGPFFFGAGNKFEEVMAAFGDRPLVRVIHVCARFHLLIQPVSTTSPTSAR